MDMDKVGWPLIIAIVGGLLAAVVGGLVVEFSKQFVPQLDEAQRKSTLTRLKLIVRVFQGLVIGGLFGAFVVSAFLNEPVYKSFDLPEASGPLTQGAPKGGGGETIQVPSGETKMSEKGPTVIGVFAVLGALAGYYNARDRKKSDDQ